MRQVNGARADTARRSVRRWVRGRGAAAAVAVLALCAFATSPVSRVAAVAAGRTVPQFVGAGDGPVVTLPSIGPSGVDAAQAPSPSGRVQDIAADPFVAHRYLALSDAALWQSTNDGASWSKLTGLDSFGQWMFEHATIAFDPVERGVVLVTSPSDRRSPTQVGVYRSTDGGQLWQPATDFRATCSGGGIGNPSVVVFHGHEALAAGGCAVGRSTDDGVSWVWSTPDSGGGFNGVTYDSAGNRFTCGSDGIFEQAAGSWTQIVDFTTAPWALGSPAFYGPFGTCRITASPTVANHLFFAARWGGLSSTLSDVAEAYLTSENSWSAVDLIGSGHNNGRDVGVQTRPDAGGFALYWGTTDATQFQICKSSAALECTAGQTRDETKSNPPWVNLGQGADPNGLHADQTRIIFSATSPHCILLVSDDGGVQKPRSGNCDGTAQAWDYTDRGISGVEFWETAGTTIVGAGHPETDLYGASQDNDAYVLLDGDPAWRHINLNGDSFLIDATSEVRTTQLASITTFAQSDGAQYIAGRGLTGRAAPAAGNTLYNPPCSGLTSHHQVDETLAGKVAMLCIDSAGTRADIYVSNDRAQTWTLQPDTTVSGHAGDQSGASLYVTRTETGANAYVVRIAGELWYVAPGSAPVNRMSSGWDVGPVAVASDGSRMITFACPPAPETCAADGQIRIWNRASNDWHDATVATDMLTQDRYDHAYSLDTGRASDGEAQSVAIAPHDPNLIAVGTLDTGVLLSGDGGTSWQRVPIPVGNINKVWFDNTDRLYVSTFGRGMLGGAVPAPDQLTVTPTRQITITGREQWTWTAHLQNAAATPVSGAQIRFTLVNDRTGAETDVGYGSTGHDGLAHGSRTIDSGTYHLLARWQPRNGAEVATEAPVVAEPTAHITGPIHLVQTSTHFVVHYTGHDPGIKSTLHYDLRYQRASANAGFGKYRRPKAWQNTTATSHKIVARPGQQWCFSVRVRDDLKHTSPWTADRCVITPVDDRHLTTVTSGWQRTTATASYLGTLTRTTREGAALRLKGISSNGVALVVTKCPTCGKVAVYIGHHLLGIQNTHAAKTKHRAVLPLLKFRQQHATITIRTTSRARVTIDGLAIRRATN
jgi:hypothetical protein